MTVDLVKYVASDHAPSMLWQEVCTIADAPHTELNSDEVIGRIANANQPGRSSAEVQSAFKPSATRLGFDSERKGLFADSITGLRPDYYRSVGPTGIILEVERGKTTINNMDLLDFWKCHLCYEASYLFLLVPKALRQDDSMSPRNEYATVERRLAPFFEPGYGATLQGLCLYGY